MSSGDLLSNVGFLDSFFFLVGFGLWEPTSEKMVLGHISEMLHPPENTIRFLHFDGFEFAFVVMGMKHG